MKEDKFKNAVRRKRALSLLGGVVCAYFVFMLFYLAVYFYKIDQDVSLILLLGVIFLSFVSVYNIIFDVAK